MSYFKVVVFPPFCTAALDISVPPPAKFHFNPCIGLQCSSPSHPVSKYQHGLTITWHHKLPGDTTVATSIFYVVLWFNDPTIHDGALAGKTNIGPAWAKPQKGKTAVGATWASLQGVHMVFEAGLPPIGAKTGYLWVCFAHTAPQFTHR